MSLIADRRICLQKIKERHRKLLLFYQDVGEFEHSIGTLPIAFSAAYHYKVVFQDIIEQSKYKPIHNYNLAILMPPEILNFETNFGFKVILSARDDSNFYIDGFNSTEASENVLLLKIIEHVDCFIDIGANIGYYCFLAAKSKPRDLTSYAIEPLGENFHKILEGVKANGFEDKVIPFKCAMGAYDASETAIHINKYGSGGNSLLPFEDSVAESGFAENIQLSCLDSFISKNGINTQNALVKIDVEGYEEEVLRGGQKCFTSDNPPIIILETFPNHKKDVRVLSQLKGWGYKIFGIRRFISNKKIIYPAFQYLYLKRSPIGNYIAFHNNHCEIIEYCKKPESGEVLLNKRYYENLEEFQMKTIESLKHYIRLLSESCKRTISKNNIPLPKWDSSE